MELSLWDASLRGGLWLEIKGALSRVPAVACLGVLQGPADFCSLLSLLGLLPVSGSLF